MRASLAAASLLPLLASVNAQSDNSEALVTAIKQTVTDISGLNSTLNSFADDATDLGLTVFGLLSGSNALQADISNSTTYAQNSSPFTSEESATIFDAVFNLVEPTFELLDNFVAHCPAFANTGLQSTVYQQLMTQLGAVQNETEALISKLASPYPSSVSVGAGLFNRGFSSVLKIYGGPPCNETSACTGSSGSGSSGSGSSPASASASPTGAAATSSSSAAAFSSQSYPAHFTGAAVKDKRSPFGALFAML